ncbi:MAG: rod-binding protein [Rhodospirillales bacterium]|nr:rod-binding protein [Rhodospirillales bacterium]
METGLSSIDPQAAAINHKIAPRIGKPNTQQDAHRVAQDFEAFFLSQVLQPMFSNLGAEEPFGGGAAEDMWRSLMVDEYGKAMAKAGGVGIADSVMRQIIIMQEGQAS